MVELNLSRDLCFFDLEATGLNVLRDRIVQVAVVRYFRDGREPEEFVSLVNPGIPISPEAMAVHGITPDQVRNQPSFQQIATRLYAFFDGADLAGYNSNRFDIPLLIEEFARVGMEFTLEHRRTIDVQRIFYKMEPRTLKAAYRFYCQRELEDAHNALADVRATVEVFKGQLAHYDGVDMIDEDGNAVTAPVRNDMQVLHEFTTDLKILDATQRLRYDTDGTVVFNFGKYMGKPAAETLSRDKQYYHWMLEKEFSHQVKQIIRKLVKEYEQAQRQA